MDEPGSKVVHWRVSSPFAGCKPRPTVASDRRTRVWSQSGVSSPIIGAAEPRRSTPSPEVEHPTMTNSSTHRSPPYSPSSSPPPPASRTPSAGRRPRRTSMPSTNSSPTRSSAAVCRRGRSKASSRCQARSTRARRWCFCTASGPTWFRDPSMWSNAVSRLPPGAQLHRGLCVALAPAVRAESPAVQTRVLGQGPGARHVNEQI